MRSTALLAFLLACGGADQAQAPPAAPAPPEPTAVAKQMDEHFTELQDARDDLINGDIAGAKAKMEAMSQTLSATGKPSEWAPYMERLRAALRGGTYSNSPQGVGRSIAAAAAVCGQCHEDLGAKVDLELPPPPKENVGLLPHMHRHAWAADRMWAGLVGPSTGAWADAARVLADKPLYEAPEGKLMNDAARTYAEQVVKAGVSTLTAASQEQRIELYGDFLGACGSCHVVTDGGPSAMPSNPQ